MDQSIRLVDRPRRGDECLPCDLTTKDALPILVGRLATKDVHLDWLEIEKCDEIFEWRWHSSMLPASSHDCTVR